MTNDWVGLQIFSSYLPSGKRKEVTMSRLLFLYVPLFYEGLQLWICIVLLRLVQGIILGFISVPFGNLNKPLLLFTCLLNKGYQHGTPRFSFFLSRGVWSVKRKQNILLQGQNLLHWRTWVGYNLAYSWTVERWFRRRVTCGSFGILTLCSYRKPKLCRMSPWPKNTNKDDTNCWTWCWLIILFINRKALKQQRLEKRTIQNTGNPPSL